MYRIITIIIITYLIIKDHDVVWRTHYDTDKKNIPIYLLFTYKIGLYSHHKSNNQNTIRCYIKETHIEIIRNKQIIFDI